MKDIKFRAWSVKNKCWSPYNLTLHRIIANFNNLDSEEWSDLKWMQYTGLKDRNDDEIYEGDIVIVPSHYEGDSYYKDSISTVYWDDTNASFAIDGKNSGFIPLFDFVNNWHGEVIGNIYENPELLIDEKSRKDK